MNINNGKVEAVNGKQLATSGHTGETVEFLTLSAAIHWLWIIDEIHGSRRQRGVN